MLDQEEVEGPSSSNPVIKRRKISSSQFPCYPIIPSSPRQQETQDQEIEGGENQSQDYYDSDQEQYVEQYFETAIEEDGGFEHLETDREREYDNSSGNEEPGGEEVPMSEDVSHSVVTIMDSDVLDCPICFAPFTIPVFQCENGHTACSSCCCELEQKCPFCKLSIGNIRCRAIEKVLQSAKISCKNEKYGCKEVVSYVEKCDHDKTCICAPCSCPLSGCKFISSSENLYPHISSMHVSDVKRFEYDRIISVCLEQDEKFYVRQEEKEGVIFILKNSSEILGNIITVSCLGPSSKGGCSYELSANTKDNSLIFRSFTKCIQSRDDPISVGFLLVPGGFYGTYEQITLDLCIWRQCECPWKIKQNNWSFLNHSDFGQQ